jgi:ubiquitin-conjugating enzyme E2 W
MNGQLPPGISLVRADDFQTWLMDVQVIDPNPLYLNETYRLKFVFNQHYPIEVCHSLTCSTQDVRIYS